MSAGKKEFSRLPGCVSPINYSVWLKPCFKTFTFAGKVDVSVKVNEPTDTIIVNSAEIKPGSAEFCANDVTFSPAAISVQEKEETMTMKFDKPLPLGNAVLKISFEGILNDKMKGFYRNQYEVDGVKKFGAVTQFEATDARRCFPCWDEPALKATFDVTLAVPKELCALSNMNIIHEEEYKGTFLISRLVRMTTENFTTAEQAKDVEVFFNEHPPAAAERTVRQSLDSIRKNVEWWGRDGKEISEWFCKQ